MSNRAYYFGVAFLAFTLAGCNTHAYYREAMQYHALAEQVLITHGICSNEQDCQKKGLLFAEGGELSLGLISWGGASITLYETSDSKVVDEISAKFKQLHAQLREPEVKLTVFSSRHLEPKTEFRKVVFQ